MQTFRHSGQWWEVDVVYPPVNDPDIAEGLLAKLRSLNGPEGTFYFGDSVRKLPRGTIAGSVTVGSGATIGTSTLPLSGGSGAFAVGDWLQISTHLYKVDQVNSGSVDVWPRLRQSYANGTAVTYNYPKGLFRLSSAQGWDVDELRIYGISFSAVEAI
jgi:hypothetical protein